MRHLFDGDGWATRLSFEADGVYFTSRFVRSAEKEKEDAAGKRIYGTYATRPVGGSIRRFINREFKNVSNTNLVYQWDDLFSLYEGGPPYRLDSQTLETLGAELFDSQLADQQKFSAHPHHDPDTGDLWNFGPTRKKETTITVYNMQKSGRFQVPFQAIVPYSGGRCRPSLAIRILAPTSMSPKPYTGERPASAIKPTGASRWSIAQGQCPGKTDSSKNLEPRIPIAHLELEDHSGLET